MDNSDVNISIFQKVKTLQRVSHIKSYEMDGGTTDPFSIIINERKEQITVIYCWGVYTYQWSGGNDCIFKLINQNSDEYVLGKLMGADYKSKKGPQLFFKNKIWPLARELFKALEEE